MSMREKETATEVALVKPVFRFHGKGLIHGVGKERRAAFLSDSVCLFPRHVAVVVRLVLVPVHGSTRCEGRSV